MTVARRDRGDRGRDASALRRGRMAARGHAARWARTAPSDVRRRLRQHV